MRQQSLILRQTPKLKWWIYRNNLLELRNEKLYRGSSKLWTRLVQLRRRESLKKVQGWKGFKPLTSVIPVQRSYNQLI